MLGQQLRIVTWNMGKRHPCGIEALEDDTVDLILGQEVPIKRKIKDTFGGGAGSRFWKVWHGGRTAIWIHKRWDRTTWRTVVGREDVVGVEILGLHVYSVYSPGYDRNWDTPLHHLLQCPVPEKAIVAGDFNMHHPLWSGYDRYSQGTDTLLELAAKWQLDLVTTPGEPTWYREGRRESTLDLIWGTGNTRKRFDGAWSWTGSDHLPQAATVWPEGRRPAPAAPRPNWKLMNEAQVKDLAKDIDVGWATGPDSLERMADDLIAQLQAVKDAAVPNLRGSGGQRP